MQALGYTIVALGMLASMLHLAQVTGVLAL